jgi:hypothetical protein
MDIKDNPCKGHLKIIIIIKVNVISLLHFPLNNIIIYHNIAIGAK